VGLGHHGIQSPRGPAQYTCQTERWAPQARADCNYGVAIAIATGSSDKKKREKKGQGPPASQLLQDFE